MDGKSLGTPAMEDPFEKACESKREKVAKNELQRLRNIARIARTRKVKVPGVGLTPVNPGDKSSQPSTDLKQAADLARKSTASLGKFQEKLTSALEKTVKPVGKKRKFDPLVSDGEKEKSLKILEQMSSKRPKVDVTKAVGKKMYEEEQERVEERSSSSRGGSRGKQGGKGGKARFSKKRASKGSRGGSTGSRGGPFSGSSGGRSSGGGSKMQGGGGGRVDGRGGAQGGGCGGGRGRGRGRGRS